MQINSPGRPARIVCETTCGSRAPQLGSAAKPFVYRRAFQKGGVGTAGTRYQPSPVIDAKASAQIRCRDDRYREQAACALLISLASWLSTLPSPFRSPLHSTGSHVPVCCTSSFMSLELTRRLRSRSARVHRSLQSVPRFAWMMARSARLVWPSRLMSYWLGPLPRHRCRPD